MSSANTQSRPHRWTAARRMQLAVSASMRQLSSPTTQFEPDTTGTKETVTTSLSSVSLVRTPTLPYTEQPHRHPPEQPWSNRCNNIQPQVDGASSNHSGQSLRSLGESDEIFTNKADVTTTNIDDAMRSLYHGTVIAQLLHDTKHDTSSASAACWNENSSWWWDDDSSGTTTGNSSLRWDRRNILYAQSQSVERIRELHADPLEAIATQLLTDERNRAKRDAEEEQREQELQAWNAFPNDTVPSMEHDNDPINEPVVVDENGQAKNESELFGDFQSAQSGQTIFIDETVATILTELPSRSHRDSLVEDIAITKLDGPVTTPVVSSEHSPNCATDSSLGQDAKESEPPLSLAQTFSNDDVSGDASSVIRQADDWLQTYATSTLGLSPAAMSTSGSSSLASVDTPELVQWTERVLQAAATETSTTDAVSASTTVTFPAVEEMLQPQTLQFDDASNTPPTASNPTTKDTESQTLQFDDASKTPPTASSPTTKDTESAILQLESVESVKACSEESTDSSPNACRDIEPRSETLLSHSKFSTKDSYVPLSLQLPADDLSTLEARFSRRRQQQYLKRTQKNGITIETEAEIYGVTTKQTRIRDLGLPSYYFTNPNLDDTASLLESLPWKYVLTNQDIWRTHPSRNSRQGDCHVPSPEDLLLWDESTTSRLCDLDSALDVIQSEILKKVQPHQPTLEFASSLIHDFEQNLRLAFMYWERSTGALEQADGTDNDGLNGPCLLLQICQQREEYILLKSALLELDEVWSRERDLYLRIDNFDVKDGSALDEYYAVIALAKSLEDVVNSEFLGKLRCLEETRRRLPSIGDHFWRRLLEILTTMVVRCCRHNSQFEWIEYERLVKAVLDLRSQTGVDHSLGLDFAKVWVERFLTSISYETERCLGVALLQPFGQSASTFDQELRSLAREVDVDWGDRAKIQGIVHNLVTIRFDLESHVNYLPGVMQRLFALLTEVLRTHYMFIQWHEAPFDHSFKLTAAIHNSSLSEQEVKSEDLRSILTLLTASTQQVWEQCETVVAKCLDEYIHFAKKSPLFKRTEDDINDTLWGDDLDALREVCAMAECFDSMKSSFQCAHAHDISHDHSLLSAKLSGLFRRHLRAVHVEAMNTIGRRLSNESWILGGFSLPVEPERTEPPDETIDSLLQGALLEASRRCARHTSKLHASRESDVPPNTSQRKSSPFQTGGNPFNGSLQFANIPGNARTAPHSLSQTLVHTTLNQMIAHNEGTLRLAPEAVTRELVSWFARLLIVMECLPLITEDVSAVFANLCDLYFTTVLRLCAGSEENERLVLGVDDPNPFLLPVPSQDTHGATPLDQKPQMFSPFRGAQQRTVKVMVRPRTILPSHLDGEICSPLPRENGTVENLRLFIERAQKSLRDVVNLNMVDAWMSDPTSSNSEEQTYELTRLLTKRLGAIWSCFAVAGLVDAVISVARCNLEDKGMSLSAIDDNLHALKIYAESTLDVIPILIKVSSQIACTRAVAGSKVVKAIINVGLVWEESKLHESCNEYVDDLCYHNALIWGYLTSSVKFPELVLKQTWESLVSSSYLSLLDGFSRVQYCSTEGRSLMALDLSVFAAGSSPSGVANRLENIVMVHKPPLVTPAINARYVESFVKVYYYPLNDAVTWIAEHRLDYKLNQSLSLVVSSYTASINDHCGPPEKSLANLMEHVKMLYRERATDSIEVATDVS